MLKDLNGILPKLFKNSDVIGKMKSNFNSGIKRCLYNFELKSKLVFEVIHDP